LRCQGNEIEKAQLLEKWNELIKILQKSRFQTHDFLRFYWCAFHENCTKKELYRKMREEIDGGDGRQIVGMWIDSAEFFSQITNIDLKFPRSSLDHNSLESTYAELNTLGYSVYLPLFLKLNRDRDSLLQQIAPVCLNYLMRIITVGKFSAGRAEGRFNKAIEMVNSEVDVKDIIACFGNDPESINDKFIERLKTQRFENNNSAKYILSKIHLHDVGSGHPLNSSVHLEHVLPQSRTSWPDFDTQSRAREDWVYSLGNMTLLEDKINNALQARLFSEKVKRFERRTNRAQTGQTAIPMSYEIHDTYKENSRDWDGDWIQKRANNFARKAVKVWPLDVTIDPPLQEMEAGSDIDNSEQI
jgi:hypothetical protein